MTARALGTPDITARRAPGLGGFNLTILGLEVRRLLRNKRTLLFTMILPAVLFLLFGLNARYANAPAGRGSLGNESAFILISMALYGAVLATTSGGAMVAIERSEGWSRQLRLTPLTPVVYIVVKMLTAMVLGLGAVVVVFIVGKATGKPDMPLGIWIASAASVWVGSLVFAAFGLFMGYLLPTVNVMQILSFALLLFSFGGGLFVPLSQFPHVLQTIAHYTPLYGLNQLVHAPLLNQGVQLSWVVNAAAWLVIFTGGAVWRFRKDTARV